MKKMLSVAVLSLSLGGAFAVTSVNAAAPAHEIDDAVVNAKLDARMRELMSELRQRGQARASPVVSSPTVRLTVR